MIAALLALQLAVAATPAAPELPDHWWADAALFTAGVAATADLSATSWALGRGGFIEANPILRPFADDPVKIAVVKSAVDGASIWVLLKYHKQRPKLVTALALAKAGVSAYVAHRNARQLRD